MRAIIAGLIAVAVIGTGLLLINGESEAGNGSVGVAALDFETAGNSCTGTGTVESTLEFAPLNQDITFDIIAQGVPNGPATDDGGGLFGIGLDLIFDPDVIEVISATGGTGNVMHLCQTPPPDTIPFEVFQLKMPGLFRIDTVDVSGNEVVTDSGRLVTVTIQCISTGQSELEFEDADTGGGNDIGFLADSGKVLLQVEQEIEGRIGCNQELGATPTPPPGEERVWGDTTCDDNVNPLDALQDLRFDAGLSVNIPNDCPEPEDPVTVDGDNLRWGDTNCDQNVDPIDALRKLRFDAGLSVSPAPPCPDVGETVIVQA